MKFDIIAQSFINKDILKDLQNLVKKLFERILCTVFVTSISDDIEKMTFWAVFKDITDVKMAILLCSCIEKIQILAI